MDSPLQTAFTLLAVVCAVLFARRALGQKKYPPGPKGYPVIGNALDIPKERPPWLTFTELSKQYGDLVYLKVFGQKWLVVNSLPVALHLLEKRGSIYSNRPVIQMANMIGLSEWRMSLVQNNDRLRLYRKLFSKVMGTTSALRRYDGIEEEESQRFLRVLLSEPEGFLEHARHFTASIVIRVTYGYQVKEHPDPFVEDVQTAMQGLSEIMTPGRHLVELIPWLRYVPEWFPGAGFKTLAKNYEKVIIARIVNEPYNWTKSQMKTQEIRSFVSDNVSDETGPQAEDLIKWAASSMYAGASDTTVAVIQVIQVFFFAMAKYPEVQARAQAEIDQVVGSDRLPSIQDKDKLPYVQALVSEVLRWHSIGPLGQAVSGAPHGVAEDDVYNGYFIPKGTTVIPNVWLMLHDPVVYHKPDEFNPSRLLKTNESDIIERDPRFACFGFGRRICPGRMMAETTIFISCAMILSAFNIRKDPSEELKYEFDSSLISHLKSFKCDIKPRSPKAVELIERPLANVNEVLGG